MFNAMYSKSLVKFDHEKCPLYKPKNCLMQIFVFVFILKIKQKGGIPLLPLFTFPSSFRKVCQYKKVVLCFLWFYMDNYNLTSLTARINVELQKVTKNS
jgi:hypothetical protein